MPAFLDIEHDVPICALFDFFEPDFDGGFLTWKPRPVLHHRHQIWNSRFAGEIAGRLNTAGHVQVTITYNDLRYHSVVHRVLWAMKNGEWPPRDMHLDHRDHKKSENSISQVRLATPTENMRNKRRYRNNTSGYKGVTYYPKYEKWMAQISVNKRNKNLGYFGTAKEGAEAYDIAAIEHFGEFAKTNAALGLI